MTQKVELDLLFQKTTELQSWTASHLTALLKDHSDFTMANYDTERLVIAHRALPRIIGFLSQLNQKHMGLVKDIEHLKDANE